MHQGAFQIHAAMAALAPATKNLLAKAHLAAAMDGVVRGNAVFKQHGGHQQLPDRAWRINALDDAVLQRETIVGSQSLPVAARNAAREKIVVVGRGCNQGTELARIGFHHHNAARFAVQRVPAGLLQVAVEREPHFLSAFWLQAQILAQYAGMGIDFNIIKALLAAQVFFQAQLKALLAHQIAQVYALVVGHFLLVRIANITEYMGKKLVFGIIALGPDNNFQARPRMNLALDFGDKIKIDIGNEQQGLKGFYPGLVLLVFFLDAGQRNAAPGRNLGKSGGKIRAILADKLKTVGYAVVGKHFAAIVEDAAARRENAFLAKPVFLGLARKFLAAVNLQIPETDDKYKEKNPDHGLQKDHAASGRLVTLVLNLDFRIAFPAFQRFFGIVFIVHNFNIGHFFLS